MLRLIGAKRHLCLYSCGYAQAFSSDDEKSGFYRHQIRGEDAAPVTGWSAEVSGALLIQFHDVAADLLMQMPPELPARLVPPPDRGCR